MGNLKDINYGIGKYLVASDASSLPDIGTNRKNLDLLNFKVAVNNAYDLYNFKDGMIDAYQTEGGVDTGTSTNETYDSTNKLYSPTEIAAATTSFTSTGAATYTCPAGVTTAEILIVAGGGGGGSDHRGGGGGAGGVVHDTDYTLVPAVVYDVTVGAAGAINTTGSNSVWNVNAEGSGITMTANGGGGGQGIDGGSGSGAYGGPLQSGGASDQPSFSGATSYGFAGGSSPASSGGGGGGGSSAVGQSTPGLTYGGYGGAGREFSSFGAYGTNSSNSSGATPGSGSGKGYFAGGGGGGGFPPPGNTGGVGGVGGGGQGAYYNPSAPSTGGFANTGGGGGARAHDSQGASAGGSGIILIKTAAATTNMTLLSNTQTAQADPTEGRLVLYEEDVDSITLDTDLKGYVSRDNGTTYTQTPLALDSTITHPTSLLLHCDGANDGVVFTDSSYWQHPATVTGSTHTDTAVKKFGTASVQFDGTDDYLDFASTPTFGFGTGDWTVDFWIYGSASGFGSYAYGFDFRPGVNAIAPGLFFDTGNGNIPGYFGGAGGTNASSNVTMSNETWYHIAVVKYNNVTKVYTDGVTGASGTYPVSYADTLDYGSSSPLRIGRSSKPADAYALNGYVDEYRVTKGVARWTANFTPDTSPYTGTEGSQRLLSGSVDISGQPAGSNMKYKVTTHNSKNLKLHGASLLWA